MTKILAIVAFHLRTTICPRISAGIARFQPLNTDQQILYRTRPFLVRVVVYPLSLGVFITRAVFVDVVGSPRPVPTLSAASI